MEPNWKTCALMHLPAIFKEDLRIFNTRDTLNKIENISLLVSYWLVYLFNHLELHPMLILYTLCGVLEYVPYIHG